MQEVNPDAYLDSLPEIVAGEVEGFDIRRSFASNTLYSVFAVDFMNNPLYPIVVDVSFDTAVSYKEAYTDTMPHGRVG